MKSKMLCKQIATYVKLISIMLLIICFTIHNVTPAAYHNECQSHLQHIFKKNNTVLICTSEINDILAAERLASTLLEKSPQTEFIFATTNLEAKLAGAKLFKNHEQYDFLLLPKGNLETTMLFMQRINPCAIWLIGQEITLRNILLIANVKQIPVYAFNVQFSHQTSRILHENPYYMIPLFNNIKYIFTLSQEDRAHLKQFEIHNPRIEIIGNLNAFNITLERKKYLNQLNLTEEEIKNMFPYPILLANVQSQDSLDLYLSLYKIAKLQYPTIKMIFVVQNQLAWSQTDEENLKKDNITMAMLSSSYLWDRDKKSIYHNLQEAFENNDIVITSRYSTLFFLQAIANIYLTNTEEAVLNHYSFIEAATWRVPIILGPNYFSHEYEIDKNIEDNIVIIKAEDEQNLISKTLLLLDDKEFRDSIGEHSFCGLLQTSQSCSTILLPFLKDMLAILRKV